MATIGSMLPATLVGLTDLILKEEDAQKRARLRAQHRQLSRQLRTLVDENVRKDTVEYEKAIAALEKANEALKEAKQDAARVAVAINRVAKAIDWLGRAAALVA